MLNIAICDDDIQITGKIERLLQDIAKRNFVDTEIEVFWNGKSLADAIAAGERYDVIYLDIEMDKEDGISAARRIRTYDKNVRIIYVTSHESYMRESFEVRPEYYGAAEPPVRCGESHLSGLTEPPHFVY